MVTRVCLPWNTSVSLIAVSVILPKTTNTKYTSTVLSSFFIAGLGQFAEGNFNIECKHLKFSLLGLPFELQKEAI